MLQLGTHPLFQRLASFRNARVFSKSKEVAEDLRERWETSDSPLVHRIQVGLLFCPQVSPSSLFLPAPMVLHAASAAQVADQILHHCGMLMLRAS
jgi:hypothetical protein